MTPDEEAKKRVPRESTNPRKEDRQVTMEIPERFRDGDDADEDCATLHGAIPNINQSLFGLMARETKPPTYNTRFDPGSSDEEDNLGKPTRKSSESHINDSRTEQKAGRHEGHRRKLSESKLIRSFSRISSRSKSKSINPAQGSRTPSPLQESPLETTTPDIEYPRLQQKNAPVMSRMLDAQAELSSRPSFDIPRKSKDDADLDDGGQPRDRLAVKLMEMFGFETLEDVIEEYDCWLMKNVLLQGFMYITTKHVCFYAYMPKKPREVIKSGRLAKRGLHNPTYNRYWFRLKDDVLSYYTSETELIFVRGHIDLRYGISASVTEIGKDSTKFTLETHERKYYFKADSAISAKEWVKALQKIIFRSHNDGDSVKISLPIENIVDVEDSPIIDFANTCKIGVVDSFETYALDEYYFSFFEHGKEALNVLKILSEDTAAQKIPERLLSHLSTADGSRGSSKRTSFQVSRNHKPHVLPVQTAPPALEEHVRATLSPLLSPKTGSPRTSTDMSRSSSDIFRRSVDLNRHGRRSIDTNRYTMENRRSTRANSTSTRRSLSTHRLNREKRTSKQGSSDSYVHSLEEPGSSEALPSTSGETQASASQILRGSDVFFSPTIQRSSSAVCNRDKDHSQSPDSHSLASPGKSTDSFPTRPQHAATTGHISDSNAGKVQIPSGPSLQSIVKAGSYPLQRAAGFAGYLSGHSKRMSTLLATESMGYVEKVSGMWKGGKKHYDEPHNISYDEEKSGVGDGDNCDHIEAANRFRDYFGLPSNENLRATYFTHFHRTIPIYGKIYISDRYFCFRNLMPGPRIIITLSLSDIENVDREKGFSLKYSGVVITIRRHEDIFFQFNQAEDRDDCAETLRHYVEKFNYMTMEERESAEKGSAEHIALQQARREIHSDRKINTPKALHDGSPSIFFDDVKASILNFKPTEPLRVTCLTIGSRGDVQPYIALCKGLMADGHKTKIATHLEFKDWVESHGIEFAPVAGDPAELMRICVDHGMFTFSFMKEASSTFRGWIDELLRSSWKACQDSDLLIESPSAMGGIHIAEALQIPYFRAFSMPWTQTSAYPHAFTVRNNKSGGLYNWCTYTLFDYGFWTAISSQVNRWRKEQLGLRVTTLHEMQANKVPFLYNFSPSVVSPPLDYSDWVRVTGYWFLDEGANFTPPKDLTDFIAKARADGKKLVYVGFGSIVVADSAALTKMIVDSVRKADVRCILSKGWSDRLDKKGKDKVETSLPPEIFQIKSAPHDWLFSQIDAAAHHGGAGTTGASLRAGIPTIIRPFFGDQFFFGQRVEDLGVGILTKLNVSVFSRDLWLATSDERMIRKARELGERIRSENGVQTAIKAIYRDMEYAESLIKLKKKSGDVEEGWTIIGDDFDPELYKMWEKMTQGMGEDGAMVRSDGMINSEEVEGGSRTLGMDAMMFSDSDMEAGNRMAGRDGISSDSEADGMGMGESRVLKPVGKGKMG